MIYVLLGPPAAGKSTQARLLAQYLGYDYIKVSALLKETAKIDVEISDVMNAGDLVPSGLVERVLTAYRKHHPKDIIIDGGFRRPKQVDTIVRLWKNVPIIVILIELDKEIIRQRTHDRHEGRVDDNPTIVEHRIHEYETTMKAILHRVEYNKLPVIRVDGDKSINEIHQQIISKLKIYDHSTKK